MVNAKFDNVSLPAFFPILTGEFSDFTVEWYRVVGSTIALTMLINIVSPHISTLLGNVIQSGIRCCDRGCSFNRRITKKLLQEDYEGIYTGPEFIMEIRYS